MNANYRAITWICTAAIMALLAFASYSSDGYRVAPIILISFLSVCALILWIGRNRSQDYWESTNPNNQVALIAILITVTVLLHVIFGLLLYRAGTLNYFTNSLLGLIVWSLVPLAFVLFGIVKLPTRRHRPDKGNLITISLVAVLISMTIALVFFFGAGGPRSDISAGTLLIDVSITILSASLEEISFRFLLLTALLSYTKNIYRSLIISSVVFGFSHVPLVLAFPIINMDWDLLGSAIESYFPQLIWQIGIGFVLGSIWIRTGSIVLIVTVHSLYNLGQVLATGF